MVFYTSSLKQWLALAAVEKKNCYVSESYFCHLYCFSQDNIITNLSVTPLPSLSLQSEIMEGRTGEIDFPCSLKKGERKCIFLPSLSPYSSFFFFSFFFFFFFKLLCR